MVETYYLISKEGITRHLKTELQDLLMQDHFARYEMQHFYTLFLEHWSRRVLNRRLKEFQKMTRKEMATEIYNLIAEEMRKQWQIEGVDCFKFTTKWNKSHTKGLIDTIEFTPKPATSEDENKPKL